MKYPSTDELLGKTSRTFALAIPLLPEPTRTTVKLAYLLFRVADTLEDAETWPRERRLHALAEFCELLEAPAAGKAEALRHAWLQTGAQPTVHEHYLELLAALPQLMGEVAAIESGAQRVVLHHALQTARGMRKILLTATDDGHVRIETLEHLQEYCYIVAGIVGEMLTALFVNDCPALARVRLKLVEHEVAFGEGLQLVNILKDENADQVEGRRFLPPGVPRAQVVALARRDLERAGEYITTLQRGGAPAGFVSFTSIAWRLAEMSLALLESEGAGAKVSRPEVARILAEVQSLAAQSS